MFVFKSAFSGLLFLFYFLSYSSPTMSAALPPVETGLEARQGALGIVNAIVGVVSVVEQTIMDLIKIGQIAKEERATEGAFTQHIVTQLRNQYPKKNVLVYHDQKSQYNLVNNVHHHVECDLGLFDTTKGFEVDVFDSGTFTLHGDKGFENWAFGGNYDWNGKSITFNPIK